MSKNGAEHRQNTVQFAEDSTTLKHIYQDEDFGRIPVMRLRFRLLYAYLICVLETQFLALCAILNAIHFARVLPDFPVAPSAPILVLVVTFLEISVGFVFEAVLLFGIYTRRQRIVRLHRYGQVAAIPILLLNAVFAIGAVSTPVDERKIYGVQQPLIILLLAALSITMAFFETFFICCLRPLARKRRKVNKSSLYVTLEKGDQKATVSSDSFVVQKFDPEETTRKTNGVVLTPVQVEESSPELEQQPEQQQDAAEDQLQEATDSFPRSEKSGAPKPANSLNVSSDSGTGTASLNLNGSVNFRPLSCSDATDEDHSPGKMAITRFSDVIVSDGSRVESRDSQDTVVPRVAQMMPRRAVSDLTCNQVKDPKDEDKNATLPSSEKICHLAISKYRHMF